ncbi:MAG: amino acid permease, partial [DPANN group archaeon]|nr:amino acid permease [DPANN group archaeon]
MVIKLKRSLGLFETTLYGVGVILGAGVYVLIGKAAALTGNSLWAAFAIGALIATFTGLSYAELSSMFQKASGEHYYAQKAFNNHIAFLVGWLIIIGGIIASATVALGFAGYFNALFKTPIIITAIAAILILTIINFWGIKEATWFGIIATFIELAGLLLIIALGFVYFGNVDILELPATGFQGLISGAALIFFAFLGFEGVVRLSEETKNPKSVIPKAIILSILITTVLYILVAISAVSILGWERLAASTAPLADVAAAAFGYKAFFILSIIALFATLSTVLFTLISTSRMLYGMASDGALPAICKKVHKVTKTPWIAVTIIGLLTVGFVLLGDIVKVASLTDFALFGTFTIVNLSLIALRYKDKKIKRGFRSPLNIGNFPVLAALGAVA